MDDRPTYQYLTLAESVRENARRHMANSAKYAAAGKFDCADGSAVKASRNFMVARYFECWAGGVE